MVKPKKQLQQTEYNKCAEKAGCMGLKQEMGLGYHKCARTKGLCLKKQREAKKVIGEKLVKPYKEKTELRNIFRKHLTIAKKDFKKNKTSKEMEIWFEGKKRNELRKDLLKEFKAYLKRENKTAVSLGATQEEIMMELYDNLLNRYLTKQYQR
jgi:hypothetical protein